MKLLTDKFTQIIRAVETAPVPCTFDTQTKADDGVYYGRLQLMAQMLDEVVMGTWVPSGQDALLHGIVVTTAPMVFDLSNWVCPTDELAETLQYDIDECTPGSDTAAVAVTQLEKITTAKHCGFSACAVGHACYDSRFSELGLSLTGDGDAPKIKVDPNDDSVSSWGRIHGELTSWDAVRSFFGITESVSEWLFQDHSYLASDRHDPAAVRDRVLQLVDIGEEATHAVIAAFNQGRDND